MSAVTISWYTNKVLKHVYLSEIRIFSLQKYDDLYDTQQWRLHCGKNDNWPMMSHPTDVYNDSFNCYQDLSEYVGLQNIWQGVHYSKSITQP